MKAGDLEEVYEGTPNEILDLVRMLDREKNRSADVENPCSTDDETDWIVYSGEECPVHSMDIVETHFSDWSRVDVAYRFGWGTIKPDQYRIVKDEDGVPYCSNEKVPEGTEYVATDDDYEVWFYEGKPELEDGTWDTAPGYKMIGHSFNSVYQNDDWENSLRRVHPSI